MTGTVAVGGRANRRIRVERSTTKGETHMKIPHYSTMALVAGLLCLAPMARAQAPAEASGARQRRSRAGGRRGHGDRHQDQPQDARSHAQGRRRPGVQLRGRRRGAEPRPGEEGRCGHRRVHGSARVRGEERWQGGRGRGRRRWSGPIRPEAGGRHRGTDHVDRRRSRRSTPKVPSITFKGPAGNTRTIRVLHPEKLQGVNVGDTVEVTYTEALAIKVAAAKK